MVLAGMKTVSSHFVHELQGIVMTGTESFTGDDISSKYEWPEAECVCVCACIPIPLGTYVLINLPSIRRGIYLLVQYLCALSEAITRSSVSLVPPG